MSVIGPRPGLWNQDVLTAERDKYGASPLFKLDITKFYFAAVQDTAGTMYRNQVGISGNEKYINSGFMLINLKKWRDDNRLHSNNEKR